MPMTVRQLANGPALGDHLDHFLHSRRIVVAVASALIVALLFIAIFTPLIGLLLVSMVLLLMVGFLLYTRKQVHGHGRLGHHRGQRR